MKMMRGGEQKEMIRITTSKKEIVW